MKQNNYDIIIIGSGPGGEGAALTLAAKGLRVVIIEKSSQIGGNCTHVGTIPSKALRHAVERTVELNSNQLFHHTSTEPHKTFKHIRNASQSVIDEQVTNKEIVYKENKVDVLQGCASFVSTNTVIISNKNEQQSITANTIIIATGSHPYHPQDVNFSHNRVFDSDSILSLEDTPKKIIIFGAGVIGSEYASIFNGLGCNVDLVDTRDQLLSFLDHEISEALSFHMRDKGIIIHHNEDIQSLETNDNSVTLHLTSGKIIDADIILWANGRTGNTAELDLQKINIKSNNRGQIPVNTNFQTIHDNIYAVGDVIGYPSLASAAYDQGRFVAMHILDNNCQNYLTENIPTGIYTIPEISSIGKTEKELTEAKIPFEVGRAKYKNLARAQISGQTAGLLKIIFHRETLKILGVHCFGYQASEILHIGQAIMSANKDNTIIYFTKTTFNYPTMAEAYRTAAINGLNRIKP